MSFLDTLKDLRTRIETRVETAFPVDGAPPPDTDTQQPVRWGRRALLAGLAVFLLWAAFAPLGQGVPTHGYIKVEGNRKTIQHLKGGVVEEILVREGDHVVANQPLIRLNETQVEAQQGIVESQLVSMLAVEARLVAERADQDKITLPQFLIERQNDPTAKEVIQVQHQLFATRRSALRGEIAIAQENISGLELQIQGLQAQEKSKAEQLRLYKEELGSLKPLYEEGFVPRNRMFELERAIAYVDGARSDDISNIGRARSSISELKLRILKARTDNQKEVETQLTDIQRQAGDLKERLVATQDDLNRVVLRAPVAGTVVDLSVHTVGGVISPGQKLMDVVPEGPNLQVEVQIDPQLIDNVRAGQEADVHFVALDQTIVPAIPGKLIYVSADRMVEERTQQPYFVGRVEVTEEGLKKLGKHVLQPGMPADVVIKTGQRTLLGYLLKPLLTRLQFTFTER